MVAVAASIPRPAASPRHAKTSRSSAIVVSFTLTEGLELGGPVHSPSPSSSPMAAASRRRVRRVRPHPRSLISSTSCAVACGRRPIVHDSGDPVLLTDWVLHAWESGSVLTIVDPRLEYYIKEEVELVLKLGLLCSHSEPSARPCMRLVLQYLEKEAPLPDFQSDFFNLTSRDEGFDQYILSCPSLATATMGLSRGR